VKEYLKWTAIAVAVLGVVVTATWLYRDSVWRERIASTPPERDTTVTTVVDTVRVPVLRADTVYVDRIDSTEAAPRWWRAVADTTVDGAKIHVEYNSPLPLAVRGFFSDISVQLPPRIDSVRTVTIVETKTVIESRTAWEWIAGAGAVGIVVGVLL
jgi:hypothetical protein